MKHEIKAESAPAPAGGHTPTPWLAFEPYGRPAKIWICEQGGAGTPIALVGNVEGIDEQKFSENATFILVACNSHAALLSERDRLRVCLTKLSGMVSQWIEEASQGRSLEATEGDFIALDNARAALRE